MNAMKPQQVSGLIGMALLLGSCSESSNRGVIYYYPDDLKSRNLPVWEVTNAIPLTPDRAVLAATSYATSEHSDVAAWDVESIELQKQFGTINTWVYSVSLVEPKSGRREYGVRVLMDGSVWKPTTKKRN
jgi:hypothetical protein